MKRFVLKHRIVIIAFLFEIIIFSTGFALGRISAPPRQFKQTDLLTSETLSIVNSEAEQSQEESQIEKGIYTEENVKTLMATITAYCPCEDCSEGFARMTATGATATAGRTIAVDPSVIPYGTEVVIDGHTYIAEDCGGAINGNKIDIFLETHEEALNWGKQEMVVIIK